MKLANTAFFEHRVLIKKQNANEDACARNSGAALRVMIKNLVREKLRSPVMIIV